jgi:hypothetical protein
MRVAVVAVTIRLALTAVGAAPAAAEPFRIGEVEGTANVELSYGLLARVEGRNPELVAITSGGTSVSANFDDGNLNYDRGIVSNMLHANLEVSAGWGPLTAHARGIAFYDFETELSSRERTDLRGDADLYVGKNVAMRDYHLGADFRAGGMPVHLRVGDQVLNWGESTFLRFGVETVTPLDVAAGFRPASAARDLQIPQGMLWAAANLTEELAVEAFYQYEWQRVRTLPLGWYLSDNDLVGADGLAPATVGVFSDQGTDLDARFQLPAGTLGFDPDFMRIPGLESHEPSDQGQGGVTVQLIVPRLNSTKLALHFLNYHSRLPIVNARTADAAAVAATSPAAVAARAAALAPLYEAEGLPPAEAAAVAASTASTLTIGEYASAASYSIAYPENIQLVGFSFNTATLRTGTLVSGEVAHHFGHPFQILSLDVFAAALSGIEFDPSFGEGPLGDYGPDAFISGVERLDKTQLELGIRQLLGPRLGASQAIIGLDIGWIHVYDLPNRDRLRLSAPGVTGPGDYDHLPNADSWGYRLQAALRYDDVFGAFTVQPYVAWLHDVGGNTPTPGGGFVAGRKALGVGFFVDYNNTWLLQLGYTNLFGAGRFNLQNDRDFVRMQLTYFY